MPAYTIPAGSNYTITQFVRSRAIKSLTFMVGNGKIKRLTLSPEVLIFEQADFLYFIVVFYTSRTTVSTTWRQRLPSYFYVAYTEDQSRDWHWLLNSTPDGTLSRCVIRLRAYEIKWIFSGFSGSLFRSTSPMDFRYCGLPSSCSFCRDIDRLPGT